jgi:two-component system, OmpR family, KDP operon response regulator KdpE
MAPVTVLVIDDEPQIRRAVRNALASGRLLGNDASMPNDPAAGRSVEARSGVRVVEAATGREGIDLAAAEAPGLIVLDLGLPDMPGIEVCREIRRWSSAPIIVLSARHADTEKVALLDAGADDYLTKPFSTIELMARARAQLRRAQTAGAPNDSIVSIGDLAVDLQRRRVERSGTLVHLTPTEWLLLRAFVTHPRQTLTHRQLFRAVWGNSTGDAQQYLRVYVGHLRRKIEADPVRPRFIQTEAGVGYRFEPEVEPPLPSSPPPGESAMDA